MKEYTAEEIWVEVEYNGGAAFKNKTFVLKEEKALCRKCEGAPAYTTRGLCQRCDLEEAAYGNG